MRVLKNLQTIWILIMLTWYQLPMLSLEQADAAQNCPSVKYTWTVTVDGVPTDGVNVGVKNLSTNSETMYVTTASWGTYLMDTANFVICPTNGNVLQITGIFNALSIQEFSVYSSTNATTLMNLNLSTPVATTIAITSMSSTIISGTTEQLYASLLDQYGIDILPTPTFSWTSSDPLIATVNQSGLVTGISAGEATITATTGTSSGSALVTVSGMPISLWVQSWWNLLSLPIQEVSSSGQLINHTAESFGNRIGADIVTGWDSINQRYISHVVWLPINNFDLVNGQWFFAHTLSGSTINISWIPFSPITPIISSGWNLLGYSGTNPVSADIFGLSFPGADIVSKFDSATQQWTSHIMHLPLNDFIINQGDGVFVHKP